MTDTRKMKDYEKAMKNPSPKVSTDVSSLANALANMEKTQRREFQNIHKSINSAADAQAKYLKDVRVKEVGYSKGVQEVDTSVKKILKKLGYVIDDFSKGTKQIMANTAKVTKDSIVQFSRKIDQELSINKQSIVALSLVKASPIFGHFAAKFMETDVWQKMIAKLKDKLSSIVEIISKRMLGVWDKSKQKFKDWWGNPKSISEVIGKIWEGVKFFAKIPFKVLGKSIKLFAKLPFLAIGVAFKGLLKTTVFLAKIPLKAIGFAFKAILKTTAFIAKLPLKAIGLAFKAFVGVLKLPGKIISGAFGALKSGATSRKNRPPKMASGGIVTKGGMAEVHAAEVVTPVSKLFKEMKEIFKPLLKSENVNTNKIVREIRGLRYALVGITKDWSVNFANALMKHSTFSGAIGVFSMFKTSLGKFRYYLGKKTLYASRLPRGRDALANTANILGLIYMDGMHKLDTLIKYVGIIGGHITGKALKPSSPEMVKPLLTLPPYLKFLEPLLSDKKMREIFYRKKGDLENAKTFGMMSGALKNTVSKGENIQDKIKEEGLLPTLFGERGGKVKTLKTKMKNEGLMSILFGEDNAKKTFKEIYAIEKEKLKITMKTIKDDPKGYLKDGVQTKLTNLGILGLFGKGKSKFQKMREDSKGNRIGYMKNSFKSLFGMGKEKVKPIDEKYKISDTSKGFAEGFDSEFGVKDKLQKAKSYLTNLKQQHREKLEKKKEKKKWWQLFKRTDKNISNTSVNMSIAKEAISKGFKKLTFVFWMVLGAIKGLFSLLFSPIKLLGGFLTTLVGGKLKNLFTKKGLTALGTSLGRGAGKLARGGLRTAGFAARRIPLLAGAYGALQVGSDFFSGGWNARDTHGVEKGKSVSMSQRVTASLGGALGGSEQGVEGAKRGASKWGKVGMGVGTLVGGPLGAVIGGAIGAIAGGLLGAIGGKNIAVAMQSIWDSVKSIVKGAWKLITLPFRMIKALVKRGKEWLSEKKKAFDEKLSNFIGTALDPIFGIVDTVINGIKDAISGIWSGIKDFFNIKKHLENIGETSHEVAQSMKAGTERDVKNRKESLDKFENMMMNWAEGKDKTTDKQTPAKFHMGGISDKEQFAIVRKDEVIVPPHVVKKAAQSGIPPKAIQSGAAFADNEKISSLVDVMKQVMSTIKGFVSGGMKSISQGFNKTVDVAKKLGPSSGFGWLSRMFESGGAGAGAVSSGVGDHGGKSYGFYQFASKTGDVKKFLDRSGYGKMFTSGVGSHPFDATWRDLGQNDPNFGLAQHGYIKSKYLDPFLKRLQSATGFDLTTRHPIVLEEALSTAVQYGPASGVFIRALQGADPSISDADLLRRVGEYKLSNVATNFKSSSAAVQKSVANRITKEISIALAQLPGGAAAALPKAATGGFISRDGPIYAHSGEVIGPLNQIKEVVTNAIMNRKEVAGIQTRDEIFRANSMNEMQKKIGENNKELADATKSGMNNVVTIVNNMVSSLSSVSQNSNAPGNNSQAMPDLSRILLGDVG